MLSIITKENESRQEVRSLLDEIARDGALRMLIAALQTESSNYVSEHKSERDANGRALVVGNGSAKERQVTLGSGTVGIKAPRVNDKRDGKKFSSNILPPYLRRSANVDSLLPLLYLYGLSTLDMEPALKQLLGEKTALSASMVTNLKKRWEDEAATWKKEKITERFVYLWADGVNLRIRLGEDQKICLLVIIGVNEFGEKKLLAAEPGYRESKDSWLAVMRDLNERGLTTPALAIGDGALGFWAALREAKGFEATAEQRCWVHKIVNVLDVLPKRLQGRAKALLHEMMYAESKAFAEVAKKKFTEELHAKYPKAVERIEKDWDVLTAFYNFPAAHWQHLRTTNPIESTFATVRLRTSITKGAGSKVAAQAMAFKLLKEAERRWKKIRGFSEIKNIFAGVAYKDGVVVTTASTTNQEATAA